MSYQNKLMKFDPQTGAQRPYPSEAVQYRRHHGAVAWLYNPWTGEQRGAGNVGADVEGKCMTTADRNEAPAEPTPSLRVQGGPVSTRPGSV